MGKRKAQPEWWCDQCGHKVDYADLSKMSGTFVMCHACVNLLREVNGFRPLEKVDYSVRHVQVPIDHDILEIRCRKYRITPETFLRMLRDQGERCAICNHRPKRADEFVIDHNHRSGWVRGLLCSKCNTALGLFRDSPDVLEAAIEYLEIRGCYGANSLAEEEV